MSQRINDRSSRVRILLLADTHLGFDQPVRPRVERRRRGPDFLANTRRALEAAVEHEADLVVHGGDLFFRARIPQAIVDMAYAELLRFAKHGIPLVIVPGNHERSVLPRSLFLNHPGIHVFDAPRTFRFDLRGRRVALAGFPCRRKDVRTGFADLVESTGWNDEPADVRLLCLHQAVEGATVGPRNFTFRTGHDVIRRRDLPRAFDAVLAGHIHRHQVLQAADDPDAPPVIYPGSIERTSFAEADEAKGFCLLDFAPQLVRHEFVPLPARPMVSVQVPDDLRFDAIDDYLRQVARAQPDDAILRFRAGADLPPEIRRGFGAARLAAHLPPSMNVQFAAGFFGENRARRRS